MGALPRGQAQGPRIPSSHPLVPTGRWNAFITSFGCQISPGCRRQVFYLTRVDKDGSESQYGNYEGNFPACYARAFNSNNPRLLFHNCVREFLARREAHAFLGTNGDFLIAVARVDALASGAPAYFE